MGISNIKKGNDVYPISSLVFEEDTERVVGKLGNVNLISKMTDITSSVSIQNEGGSGLDTPCIIATEPEMLNYNRAIIKFIKFVNSADEVAICTGMPDTLEVSSVEYYHFMYNGVPFDFVDNKTITLAIVGYVVEEIE